MAQATPWLARRGSGASLQRARRRQRLRSRAARAVREDGDDWIVHARRSGRPRHPRQLGPAARAHRPRRAPSTPALAYFRPGHPRSWGRGPGRCDASSRRGPSSTERYPHRSPNPRRQQPGGRRRGLEGAKRHADERAGSRSATRTSVPRGERDRLRREYLEPAPGSEPRSPQELAVALGPSEVARLAGRPAASAARRMGGVPGPEGSAAKPPSPGSIREIPGLRCGELLGGHGLATTTGRCAAGSTTGPANAAYRYLRSGRENAIEGRPWRSPQTFHRRARAFACPAEAPPPTERTGKDLPR